MIRYFLRKITADSSGAALVYTLLVTAVLMIAAVAIISMTGIDSKLVLAQENRKIAQYAAESAVEVVRQQLLSEGQEVLVTTNQWTRWTSLSLGDIESVYRYKVLPGSDKKQYVLEVQTQVNFKSGKTSEKDLELIIKYTPGKPGKEPNQGKNQPPQTPSDAQTTPVTTPARQTETIFQYALLGGGNLPLIDGNLNIAGSVFSNGSIQLAPNFRITGPIKAVGTVTGFTNAGGVTIEQFHSKAETLPVVNWQYLRAKALENNSIYIVAPGTRQRFRGSEIVDKIVYVEGNVTITGGIPGNCLVAASGDITIQGTSQFGDDAPNPAAAVTGNSPKGTVGFIAGQNIHIVEDSNSDQTSGNLVRGPDIRGLLLAGNDVINQGQSIVYGSIIAGNQYQTGNTDENYILRDSRKVENVLNFAGSQVFSNYDEIVPPKTQNPLDEKKNIGTVTNPASTQDSHSGTENTAGTPPEITIVRWKELN